MMQWLSEFVDLLVMVPVLVLCLALHLIEGALDGLAWAMGRD